MTVHAKWKAWPTRDERRRARCEWALSLELSRLSPFCVRACVCVGLYVRVGRRERLIAASGISEC